MATKRSTFTVGLALGALGMALTPAAAQAPAIMAPGDAIVTGFSGTIPPNPPPPGNPLDETFININGASVRIQRLQPAGPPAGQAIAAPTVFAVTAAQTGQVFGITLDDAPSPNIYVTASSAYGLEIVAQDADADGRPERLIAGQPGASFMGGQWGTGGNPGSIYRIDGTTGAVTLFTTIGANGAPGLGNITFDRTSRQFYVSDLDTGLIYRIDAGGFILSNYDHGATGRPAAGLPAILDDGAFADIQNPAFRTDNPATWGYTQADRMVWGLTIRGGRIYYGVGGATPSVWSVGIGLDGSFLGDARWEFDADGLAGDTPISDMLFDAQGRLVVAQRGPQQDSYDYSVFHTPLTSSVGRYTREFPDNPLTPSTWIEANDEYAVGFRPEELNTNGGVAMGYGYTAGGAQVIGTCNEYLWMTGESLRDNPAIDLSAGGPFFLHGLQGNHRDLVRPANDPPVQSYFADYDGVFNDPQAQGHIGDVEIWQPCGQGYVPPYIPPVIPPPTYEPPPVDTIDLSLDKEPVTEVCDVGGIGFICEFIVRITNTGTLPYWGAIEVIDWLPDDPPGATVTIEPSPPWVCGPFGPTSEWCTLWPALLFPGESVDMEVTVELPADTELCELTNAATLTWPPGFGDANPGNDFDLASILVPGPFCPPPSGEETNLILEKSSLDAGEPPFCFDAGPNVICNFLVEVTNEGPGSYEGDIVVDDVLSVDTPIITNAPWACVSAGANHTCTYPDAMLGVGESVAMWVQTTVPKADLEAEEVCFVHNEAAITQAPGGTPLNTNPFDDEDDATNEIIAEYCEPEVPPQTDLSIDKAPHYCASLNDGLQRLCGFTVHVTNEGPGDFFGILAIKDVFTEGVPVPPSPAAHPPGVCVPDGGGGLDCSTLGPIFLGAGATTPPLSIIAVVDEETCTLTNEASIVAPLGGTVQNTNPGNDTADATIEMNFINCLDIPPEPGPIPPDQPEVQPPTCPIERRTPDGSCCPEGEQWNGQSCSLPRAPPPAQCPPGTQGTPPACIPIGCPPGLIGTPPACTQPPPETTPPPTQPPPRQPPPTQPPPREPPPTQPPPTQPPPTRPQCPPGTQGIFPICIPTQPPPTQPPPSRDPPPSTQCPPGQVGTPPNCRIPPSQPPTTRPPGNLTIVPQTRVPQTTAPPPSSTPPPQGRQCPPGTQGIFPICIPTN